MLGFLGDLQTTGKVKELITKFTRKNQATYRIFDYLKQNVSKSN